MAQLLRGAGSPCTPRTAMPKPVAPYPPYCLVPSSHRTFITSPLDSDPNCPHATSQNEGEKGRMPFPYFPFSISYLSTRICIAIVIEKLKVWAFFKSCRINQGLSSFSCLFEEGPGRPLQGRRPNNLSAMSRGSPTCGEDNHKSRASHSGGRKGLKSA